MHIKNKKGQSTVEYVLLVTAVVAVMIAFATNKNGGLQGQLTNVLTNVTNEINSEAGELDSSHPISASSGGSSSVPPYSINVAP